jgi:hypothetical protein
VNRRRDLVGAVQTRWHGKDFCSLRTNSRAEYANCVGIVAPQARWRAAGSELARRLFERAAAGDDRKFMARV